jgi:hypothetical protein
MIVMTEVYVVRNQLGHYWGKSKAWADGRDPKAVARFKHEDEAVNTLFELSSKDIGLRGEVVVAELSERGEPQVEPSEIPLPQEEAAEEPAAEAGADSPEEERATGQSGVAAEPTLQAAPEQDLQHS